MKAYKITNKQKDILQEESFSGMQFNPLWDINGDWFIWEIEAAHCIEKFNWQLTEGEYTPPVPKDM